MGMFDNVKLNYKIDGNYQKTVKEWQTKDLDCQLDLYIINEDGKLWKQECPYGDPEPVFPIERFCHNGTIQFYGQDESAVWIDCVATFDDGVIMPETIRIFAEAEEI